MNRSTPERQQSLEAAFNLFNQLSEELTGSYQQLQHQVLQLSSELAAARSERTLQLADKERIADRLERLLETLPAAVIVLDGEECVQEFNPAARSLLGSINEGDDWRELRRQLFQIPQHSGDDLRLCNGRILSISSCDLEQAPGRILVMLDVTETRKLQERLNRQERLGAMGEMSAQLAHQMRTPLSSALLYTSHLSRDDLTSGQRQRFTGKLRSRLQHMERQIRDILMFARGSSEGEEIISLSELLGEFAEGIRPELSDVAVTLKIEDLSAGAAVIKGRRDALLGVLSNLTDNALQQGAKRITLLLRVTDDVELLFSDNGPGVPAEIREQIFDPFFTNRAGGTGLGLAVVQNLVLSHHGEIRLTDSLNGGACFQLAFPLVSLQQTEQQIAVKLPVLGVGSPLIEARRLS
ncbi:MAG: histidine kinase [endosymbiont of Seepiophila jonesi]|uniref:histidine kinase n=1 Tax=endosymbiont of Lamellibrachia luymesi TaxID=2200907 RepID=A0A370E0W9_9GAMM|nr:MAG: histidine kinase [endosymbiont of Seepiophila jonesi]RDH93180.1 MAG: histidine kinase [endosymbiont of Lamellibrachia luymesi]